MSQIKLEEPSEKNTGKNTETKGLPLWRLPFRPFFLGGCLFSLVAIALWWASLRGYLSIGVYGNWLWWHSHEMIFGFACAIIVGFLLTAVQHWTGLASIKGKSLVALFALWLFARVAMFLPLPYLAILLPDVLFMFFAARVLMRLLLTVKMYRNLVFVLVLIVLALLNIASHGAMQNGLNPLPYFHAAIMIIVFIITVMGGRVIPLFTANALKVKAVKPPKIVEISTLVATGLLIIFSFMGFALIPMEVISLVAVVGFIAHSYRLVCWFNKGMLGKPILWSLHLSYSFIPLGMLFILFQSLGWGVNNSLIIHAFTVGGIGGVILAMVSRVILGHTGRSLILPSLMPAALFIFFLGAFIRILVPWVSMAHYSLAIDGAALCWGLAILLFLINYAPFLVSARIDGKSG